MILLAIDPGAHGALAIRWQDHSVTTHPFTSESDLLDTLKDIYSYVENEQQTVTAYIEQVGGYIGKAQPGSAMFNFGRNFGFILGTCQALGFKIHLVTPAKWQKQYPTRTTKTQNATQHKRELKDHAARLYPSLKPTLATADALLILDYAIHQQQ